MTTVESQRPIVVLGDLAETFIDDPMPPKRLFARGDIDLLGSRSVAVVGTRQCTQYGISVTREIVTYLAQSSVAVVSGLALGIDAAAHAGVIEAGGKPIAVVGSGLDVVYPRKNGPLWRAVERKGLVLSEYPLGTSPDRWRFPARNRLIAALADVVVVVESHLRGGSLSTAAEAVARDRPVFAVPGSIRSPASGGTNSLIADGAFPLCEPSDLGVALGLCTPTPDTSSEQRPVDDPVTAAVLDVVGHDPCNLEQLMLRSALTLPEISKALAALEERGDIIRSGGWFERS
jgi:DNA processing protein